MTAIASVKVDMSGLKRIQGEIDARASMVIRKTAFDVEGRAKRRARVDTGALRASIYTSVGGGESNYAGAVMAAKALNPGATFTPEARAEGLSANVGASADYAIHHEFGTRKMGAQPMLVPALEEVRKPFLDAWKELVK